MTYTPSLGGSPIGTMAPIPEGASAYLPSPLPRTLSLADDVTYLLVEATQHVAMLAGAGELLRNPNLLIAPLQRREALLSSRIEGTQASLADVYRYEAGVPGESDAQEVTNYVRAVVHAREMLETLPLSLRVLLEAHRVLLTGVRGRDTRPGEFRDRQVWIGTAETPIEQARYVPPPHQLLEDLLADWERFVNDEGLMTPLVRAALMHYQFEAIHPFVDGNGRIGRLLIPLLLQERGLLPQPLLYLSAYFERRRGDYYDHLLRLSETGDWNEWLRFFLTGVTEQAQDALRRVRALTALHERYRARLADGKASGNALRLLDHLFVTPYVWRGSVMRALSVTNAGAGLIIDRLAADGVLEPFPGTAGRARFFWAPEIMQALE